MWLLTVKEAPFVSYCAFGKSAVDMYTVYLLPLQHTVFALSNRYKFSLNSKLIQFRMNGCPLFKMQTERTFLLQWLFAANIINHGRLLLVSDCSVISIGECVGLYGK